MSFSILDSLVKAESRKEKGIVCLTGLGPAVESLPKISLMTRFHCGAKVSFRKQISNKTTFFIHFQPISTEIIDKSWKMWATEVLFNRRSIWLKTRAHSPGFPAFHDLAAAAFETFHPRSTQQWSFHINAAARNHVCCITLSGKKKFRHKKLFCS